MNNEEPGIKRLLYDLREHLGNELLKLEERVGLLNSYLRRTDYLEGTPDHRISEVEKRLLSLEKHVKELTNSSKDNNDE